MSTTTLVPGGLTGPQKAAVLLLQMSKERSAKVLRSMRESEVAEIMAEVARLRNIDPARVGEVLEEFRGMADQRISITSGGLELARSMLEETPGRDQADETLNRVTQGRMEPPLEFLHRAEPRQALSFSENEHPPTHTPARGNESRREKE